MTSTALTKAATNALVRAAVGSAVTKLTPATKNAIKQAAANGARKGATAAVNYIKSRNGAKRRRTNVVNISNYRVRRNTAPVSYANGFGATTKPVRLHMTEVIGDVYSAPSQVSSSANANDLGVYFKWPWQKGNDAREFNIQALPLNPAHPLTFPWLSNIAKLFDKYKFHKLVFTYTNNVSTARDGRCCFAVDFDTLDKEPQNMQAMAQLSKFNTFAPFVKTSFSVPLSHPGHSQWLYTFDASSVKNDLKTYNLGTLFVGTEGVVPNKDDYSQPVGTLSVEYDVSLMDKSYVSPTARVSQLEGSVTNPPTNSGDGSGVAPPVVDTSHIWKQYAGTYLYSVNASSSVEGNIKEMFANDELVKVYNDQPLLKGDCVTIFAFNWNQDTGEPVWPIPSGDWTNYGTITYKHGLSHNETALTGLGGVKSFAMRVYNFVLDRDMPADTTLTIRTAANTDYEIAFIISPPAS